MLTASAEELDAIVSDYFAMLALEREGRAFVKRERARALMARIGRSHGSVERKHMNISAVLGELGRPTIKGYKSGDHYQGADHRRRRPFSERQLQPSRSQRVRANRAGLMESAALMLEAPVAC